MHGAHERMRLPDERGQWNGVKYSISGQTFDFGLTNLIVHPPSAFTPLPSLLQIRVEKSLFERPGEELETMDLTFSGCDWCDRDMSHNE